MLLKIRSFLILAVAIFALAISSTECAQAQTHVSTRKVGKKAFIVPRTINPRTSDAFMRKACVGVIADLNGLEALLAALNDLIIQLQNIAGGLANANLIITPPRLCLPDLDFGATVNIPNLDNLTSCLGSFSVKVSTPDFSGVGSCLANFLPSLDLKIPNFDPNQTLACLGNLNATLDLPNLRALLNAIAHNVGAIIAALQGNLASLNAKLDPNFFLQLKALAQMCSRAGFRQR